jgi:hypothetical protein
MQAAAEQAFLSRADCQWTQIGPGANLYCRVNGRMYHLFKAADDAVGRRSANH